MSIQEANVPPKIAGFWRRLGAFLVDMLVLGVIGIAIGALFFDTLAKLGPWGRLFGFAIAMAYFGILNSRLGNGETLGKRMLGITVVGVDGMPLTLWKSALRFLPLGAAWFLNNAQLSFAALTAPWSYLLSMAVFGVGLCVVYLVIFNRRTRQSLQDLLVGSYVVEATGTFPAPHVRRAHLVVCAALMAASAALPLYTARVATSERFSGLIRIHQAVSAEPGVLHANAASGKTISGKGETTYLNVVAYLDAPDFSSTARAKRLATLAMETDATTKTLDFVGVTLLYGYDIGIASSWKSHSFVHAPAQWSAQ
jgi:uncharacterized RDD family membrane protein YckC